MPDEHLLFATNLELSELAAYQEDVTASLRLYFSSASPTFPIRFAGQSYEEIADGLAARVKESDIRSCFALLTGLEASFQIDFSARCRKKFKDDLSVYFRSIRKARGARVRLDEDILEGWKLHTSASALLISQIRGAFKFRHWIAHGRYWSPKLGKKYDFDSVYLMVSSVVSGFPFVA
jgi:hypothetical protein